MFVYPFNILFFLYSVIKSSFLERKNGRKLILHTIVMQTYFTGFEALPIVSITAFALGAVVISQSTTILSQFGLGEYVDKMIIKIMIRELSPLILALIVIGRSGSAISTEIGNMKLNREFQTLDVLGISLDYFIVLPRVLGMIISFICLSIYFNIVAIFGGFLIINLDSISSISIWANHILEYILIEDIFVSALKSCLFGLLISIIASFHGFSVKEAFTEVPQVTTKAIVNSIVFCFCINVILALVFFPTGVK